MEQQGPDNLWHPALRDPTGEREMKPRRTGQTMVIDKGLGLSEFADLVRTAAAYIDIVKLGFGTAALYPSATLRKKIELTRENGILIMPGGTLLEAAIANQAVENYFTAVTGFGFTAIEVSDGTIEMSRTLRSSLIVRGIDAGLTVVTEHGKKQQGSLIEIEKLAETVQIDTGLGATFVTIEARESGKGVGVFDEKGNCDVEHLRGIAQAVPDSSYLMWEAPLKSQQAELLRTLGFNTNIGNVSPIDVLALEALRRGLRADTFIFGETSRVK